MEKLVRFLKLFFFVDIRIRRGLQPLEQKSFYLDIKNHAIAAKLEAQIRELGGERQFDRADTRLIRQIAKVVELFLVRGVNLVASDRVDKAGHTNFERPKWACISGGSGGLRSLRSIEIPTPTPPTPLLSSECPSSNSTLRGQTTQRSKSRVDAMLERALTQPQQCSVDPLNNAHSWGIPIWTTDKLQAWLDRIYESIKNTSYVKQINQHSSTKVKHLKRPYVKFDSVYKATRPVFLELSSWPTLNFDGDPGSCPFDTKKQEKRESKLINKEVKENKRDTESINKAEGKEMTRRPRATAARARRTEQLVAGYCELCRIHYEDLSKHVQSEQHLNFVGNDDNFLSLDTLINAGANVEAFLKLNRTKDIEKDCDLFPNGDGNLHNVLPEEKVNKNTKTLNNFTVNEIKMVNGARRNLNLKLSSSHNLRARISKHESGHLLRSKGSPWHEVDKSEKLYDKLEGFTIKKRSKGTIWIEEDDPDEKYTENILKESKQEDYKIRPFSNNTEFYNSKEDNINNKHSNLDPPKLQSVVHRNAQNGIANPRHISEDPDYLNNKNEYNGDENVSVVECTIKEVDVVDNNYIVGSKDDPFQRDNCALQAEKMTTDARKFSLNDANEIVCNGHNDKSEQRDLKTSQGENTRYMKSKHPRVNRRGGRNIRGRCRARLSVEERLIEDNRAYYKVEVLGNKLRSSAVPSGNSQHATLKDGENEEKKEAPSNEKPVVVRFKRVRKSELSLLSDEAESFMFGEPKRDDSSERTSDSEQSSVLPRDTESEPNDTINSSISLNSSLNYSSIKQEIIEEDSQDSVHLGRARKRRRTQAEAFIKDNTDYYKFETPGSRLRYQAPLTGVKDTAVDGSREHGTAKRSTHEPEDCKLQADGVVQKIYPSKPSAEIEKMQFSFESIPMSEPWYQTYQRQDAGAEFWHCFSECEEMKPFLLPYEIENFHETLAKAQSRIENGRRRGRGRGIGCMGRSPRKSPRCHASTLAIMSTIIRKKEQSILPTIEESSPVRSRINTPKLEQKPDLKLDVDEEIKEIARTIDEMLCAKGMTELDDSFEPDVDLTQADGFCQTNLPKGAPPNLLELLDNCQDITNCLENNSSCASSECGEVNADIPLKRRKRRKNRTGWPVGNKMKKKIQPNSKILTDCDQESLAEKKFYPDGDFSRRHTLNTERIDFHAVTTSMNNAMVAERLGVCQKNDDDASLVTCTTSKKSYYETLAKKDKNIEAVSNDNTGLSASTDNYKESISENACDDGTNKTHLSNKDYPCRKDLSEIKEVLENNSGNDENHENQKNLLSRKDVNTITENLVAKSSPIKKQRQREHVTVTSADSCELRDTEIENQDNLQLQCRKEETGIVPKKHHNSNSELSPKRQLRGGNCEENSSDTGELLKRRHGIVFATTRRGRIGSRKRIYPKKRQSRTTVTRNNANLSSDRVGLIYEDENCKKDAYLSITSCNKKQPPSSGVRGSVKRKSEAISSSDNIQESSNLSIDQCALSERISPSIISSSELEQRRSSIEFQPVVRMMKIDDQIDIDHSILSTVTVASNRRLRSSVGSRSNPKPPKKRVKSGRGHFGRWLKNS
ncbi:Protein chiffon [Trachymyrmex septentrionalis]|uniref:Protein chiffon n=1 Tax=Trachymyrmex septentrionalis TaxID=34720 RepID=A0A195FJ72_9HYME|nr:Protein chiffon [Trachymyrmex septentrionalis]